MSLPRLTLAPLLCAALFCSQVQAKVAAGEGAKAGVAINRALLREDGIC